MENLQEAVSIYDNMIENFVLHNEFREMSTDNKENTLTILLKSLKNTIIAYHDNSLFITQHIIQFYIELMVDLMVMIENIIITISKLIIMKNLIVVYHLKNLLVI